MIERMSEAFHRCIICGCYWNRGSDGIWSLADKHQTPCSRCDNSPDFLRMLEPAPAELRFGSFGEGACDICGHGEPHTHTPWEVERERYCRPAFETFFKERILTVPVRSGLDRAGTYGWFLFWNKRGMEAGYWLPQTDICWCVWQGAWRSRAKQFPEIEAACRVACGEQP